MKKVRICLLPNKEQELKLWEHVNQARNVKNIFIFRCWELKDEGEFINKKTSNKLRLELTEMLKTDKYKYLNKTSRDTKDREINDVVQSFVDYYNGTHGKPKYKKKRGSNKSFNVREARISRKDNYFKIPSIGYIKATKKSLKNNVNIVDKIKERDKFRKASIKYDGKHWYLFITYDDEKVNERKPRELTNEVIGIDLGISPYVTCSNKKVIKNINSHSKIKKLEKRLSRLQRQASRKYEMNKEILKVYLIDEKGKPILDKRGNYKYYFNKTKNIIKVEKEITKVNRKIKNIRQNFIHTITKEIVEQYPQEIVIEDLKVEEMKNKFKHRAKSIGKANWYTFRKFLTYKCEDRGILLTVANKWYPSSQTCSNCGNRLTKQDKLSLKDRTFNCTECNSSLDRDLNASINLMNYRYSKWYQDNIIS